MKWAEFKTLTVRDLLAFGDALAKASSVEDGAPESGVLFHDQPIEEVARTLVIDFLDNGVLRFEDGSLLETLTDTGISLIDSTVPWVDRALGLVRFATPVLDARPLEHLPF
jgi:hypothetical protein